MIIGNRGKKDNQYILEGGENKQVTLFFDKDNPIMKKLLHLDYFEYEKEKQTNPELLKQKYTEDEIEIFDNIIEPYSLSGVDFHLGNRRIQRDWSAIPGGIPSALVNGICIRKIEPTKEYLDEIGTLFPNATIFDNTKKVIRQPINIRKKEKNNNIKNESDKVAFFHDQKSDNFFEHMKTGKYNIPTSKIGKTTIEASLKNKKEADRVEEENLKEKGTIIK